MYCNIEKKIAIFSKFGNNEQDTGNTEVQIAFLTERINYLQKHFIKNKKDYHSRRGLLKIVAHRRKLLKYLRKYDKSRYVNLISYLELRH